MILNDQQRAAVESTAQRIAVVAGAGTGKTRTLVARIAHRIEQGADPSRICGVTFTRKAATELKERLAAEVGDRSRFVVVGTFHSLTASFIRRLCEVGGTSLRPDFSIYDDVDSSLLFSMIRSEISPRLPKKELERRYTRAETLTEHEDRDTPQFRIWREYHRRLLSMNALDFGGIIETFFEMLSENPDVFKRHADRFSDICVDEYQDTDRMQDTLVKMAIAAGKAFPGNLFLTGDVRQSIFGWRSAEPKIMQETAADPGVEVYHLTRNYRSTVPIVEAANKIESQMTLPAELQSGGLVTDKPGTKPVFFSANLHSDEARQVAQEIQDYIEIGGSPSDVAVIYRAHRSARHVSRELEEREIPFHRVGSDQDIWRHGSMRQIVRLLRLCCNTADDQSFEWLINWPVPRFDEVALAELKLKSLEDFTPMLLCAGAGAEHFARCSDEIDLDTPITGALIAIDSIMHLTSPDVFMDEAALNAVAIEAIGEWEDQQNEGQNTVTVAGPTVSEFLDWFVSRSMQDEIKADRKCVTLCSCHAAKGLEWPVVYVIDLEQGRFPIGRAGTDQEEELRLFYVAITRARNQLYLCRATENSRGMEIKPSRFLGMIVQESK